jgi:hypothetical protein
MVRYLLIILVGLVAISMAQSDIEMDVAISGSGAENGLLVGGTYDVIVTLKPVGLPPGGFLYQGVSDWTWPKNLTLEVGRGASPYDPFQQSAILFDHMQFEYYVPALQASMDKVWRTRGTTPPNTFNAPKYYFAFRVPPELVGAYLFVKARWDHPLYGQMVTGAREIKQIEAPDSDAKQHTAWRTNVHEARQLGRLDQAIALSDSFITLGWHDLQGLTDAIGAAQDLGRYDDAIRLLDYCFEANHTVEMARGVSSYPTETTESSQAEYQRIRANLIEKKNGQKEK